MPAAQMLMQTNKYGSHSSTVATMDSLPDGGVYQLDEDAWLEQGCLIIEPGYSKDTRTTKDVLKTGHHSSRKWGLVIVLKIFDDGKMARYVPIVPLEPSFTNPVLHLPLESPNFAPLPLFESPIALTNTWPACFLLSHRACVRFDRTFDQRLAQLTSLKRPGDGAPLRLTSSALSDLQWRMRRREERQLASAEKALEGLDLTLLGNGDGSSERRAYVHHNRGTKEGNRRETPTASRRNAGISRSLATGPAGGTPLAAVRRTHRPMQSWSRWMYGRGDEQGPPTGGQAGHQSRCTQSSADSNTDQGALQCPAAVVGSRLGPDPFSYSYSSNYDDDDVDPEYDSGAATPPALASRPTTSSAKLSKTLTPEEKDFHQDSNASRRSSRLSANLSEGETLVERDRAEGDRDRDRWSGRSSSMWSVNLSVTSLITGKGGASNGNGNANGNGAGSNSRRASTVASTVSWPSFAASERPTSGAGSVRGKGGSGGSEGVRDKESDMEVELQPWKA